MTQALKQQTYPPDQSLELELASENPNEFNVTLKYSMIIG